MAKHASDALTPATSDDAAAAGSDFLYDPHAEFSPGAPDSTHACCVAGWHGLLWAACAAADTAIALLTAATD